MYKFSKDSKLIFRAVQRNDWSWIKEWYRDAIIDRELGPMNKEWLEYVLSDRHLAVHPELRRQGLGRYAISNIVKWDGHPFNNIWVAYVAKGNDPAAALLKVLGWRAVQGHNNMRKFTLKISEL